MPRRNIERKIGGNCKIRKRCSSSSTSSSSSLVKNYRLKRAILVGKKAGSSTPIPTWKMALRSPSVAKQSHGGEKGKEAQMSARRLAATLWEINGLQSPGCGEEEKENFEGEKMERDRKNLDKTGKLFGTGLGHHTHLLDQSHSPVSKKKDGSKPGGHRRRSSANSQKLQLIEYMGEGLDSVPNGASIKVASHGAMEASYSIKTRLKDVSSSLTASKELVKVLFRMWTEDEQSSSRLTLVSALRVEIDRARHQVDQLMHEQRYSQKEVDALFKQFASEKAVWKSKEQDRIFNAISSVARELEIEKKMRRQTERLNKRLGRELANTRDHLSKAVKELDCERRAREVLEQTCDELARGLGEDRAKVEELMKESAKAREEVERERQMLQLADVLREERVQMKLADARYEFEEKNEALERLRRELEVYLGQKANHRNGANGDNPINFDRDVEFSDFLKKHLISCQNEEREQHDDGEVEEDGEEDSGDSELHSIELNMDNLSKSYKWSFVNDRPALQGQADSRRASVEEVFKGRKSLSEKIQWESICLQRKTSDGIEWDFTTRNNNRKVNTKGFDNGRLSEASSEGEKDDDKSIKVRKDTKPLPSSRGGQVSASSRPQSPPGTGNSRSFSVNSLDQFDDNGGGRSNR